MTFISPKQQKQILKKVDESSTNSISSAEFNRILLSTITGKKTKINNTNFNKNRYDFDFTFNVEKINEKVYKFTLLGKHVSTNTYNGYVSLGKRCAYKNAIKNAAYNFYLINKSKFKQLLPESPFENATIEPTAYNPRSRDDDGCSVTLKTLRDMLVTYKFLKDDNRKHVTQLPTKEVINKDYKIELLLTQVA
jgi:hypothetical protein